MSWQDCTLGDVLTLQRGFDITKAQQSDGPFPVVSSSGVNSYHADYKCEGPGVVIGRKGTLGTAFFLEGAYWPHDTSLWVKDFKGNDPRFCYYLLKSLGLEKYDVGSSNPTLNRNHLHLLDTRAPAPPAQRAIADILSAYDDLIENNTRRIAILEDMARRLFEEWFVCGKVPDGQPALNTRTMPISEAFEIVGGGTPSKAEPAFWDDGTVDWYTPTDLTKARAAFLDRSKDRISDLGLAKSGAQLFPANSIMMTSRATLGVFAINTGPATTNQGFITSIPNEKAPLYWLYHWLKVNAERFEGIASGATFKEITKGNFKKLEIELPDQASVQAYDSMVKPMMETALSLLRANTNLRTTRDLLLPKLISGEIEVRAAEEELEAAAA